ncbi:MAG: glycosyltransferase family 9 protein [Candidatus Kaelpia aquatica]|nr:glycosyltransferase family 9 protein [Candidatus Kaelpia aquatica]
MHILITNPFGIGDVLFSLPMVYALKEQYPNSRIDYLCNRRVADILKTQEDIGRVYVYEKDEWRAKFARSKLRAAKDFRGFLKAIKRERYDVAFDLSLSREFGFILWFLGIKLRVGYNYKNRGIFLNKNTVFEGFISKHVVQYHLQFLSTLGIGAKYPEKKLSVPVDYMERAKSRISSINKGGNLLVAVIPGGGASWGGDAYKKRWADERYSRLSHLIAGEKTTVLVMGDESDSLKFAAPENCKNIYNYMGQTKILELIALTSQVDLVITNDGGPLHIAAALGVPTISIFGPVPESVYGPYPANIKHRVITADLGCRPCYYKFKVSECNDYKCLNDISVDYLFDEFKKHVKLLGLQYEDKIS